MKKSDYIDIIIDILHNKFYIPKERITQNSYDLSLTGKYFNLDSIDLTYLFFQLEKQLELHIDAHRLLNYEFNTINGIAQLLTSDS